MTKDKNVIHETFVTDILTILTLARQKAYSAVNFAMVDAYWHIGKRIIEEEQLGKGRADYGTYLIKELAQRLSGQLGKGFSVANLWNFRQFYQAFPSEEMLYTLCRELSWSHLCYCSTAAPGCDVSVSFWKINRIRTTSDVFNNIQSR
jgi:hypothetical protein